MSGSHPSITFWTASVVFIYLVTLMLQITSFIFFLIDSMTSLSFHTYTNPPSTIYFRFVFFFFSLVAKKWLNICEMENNIPSTLLKPQVTLALWRSALWWRLMQRHHSYGWLWQDSAREAYETLHWRKSPSSLQEVLQRVITRLLPILDEQQN